MNLRLYYFSEGSELKSLMEHANSSLKNLKFYIRTFGCQMNENDSERIAGILAASGAKMTDSPEKSDIIIVNTCAVRKKSEEKLYSYLGRMAPLKKMKKVIIAVTGCVAQIYQSKLLEKKPFIDFILGPDNYSQIPQIFACNSGEKFISSQWSEEWREIPNNLIIRESPFSAFVTIMEGCNNFCSYCVVPYARGREKFRPLQNIIKEIEDLAKKNYLEIQLLGQNVNSYRDPETGNNFSTLLKEANRVKGVKWIRFITSHPKNFTKDIAQTMKESRKICHQLHLPVQSGSSSVLKRMNRGYTREDYLEKISMLRDLMPDISLSTDIMVGYPEETEEEFEESLSILEKIRYTNIFSFLYSPRPFTAALAIKDTVPFKEKKWRLIKLQGLQKKFQLEFNRSLVGSVMKVFCMGKSKKNPHFFSGRNEGFQVINFKTKKDVVGQFVNVHITSCGPYSLIGKMAE